MDRELKQKLKEIAPNLLEEKDMPIFLEVQEINEHLEGIHENLEKMANKPEMKMEMPEVQKISIEGAEVISIKGKDGKDGETPTDEHLIELIKPLIPPPIKPKDGKDGYTPIKGIDYFDGKDGESIVGPKGEDGKDGSPDTPIQVKEKLLEVGLTIEDIKDLRNELDDLKKKWSSRPMFGGGGFSKIAMDSHFIDDETPDEVPNGVITDFTLKHKPNPESSLRVFNDGQRMKLGTDYTFSGNTVTYNTAPLTGVIITFDYRI